VAVAVIIALWVIIMALVWAWICAGDDLAEAPAAADGDPFAAEVDAFRRELHDWDRGDGGTS